MISPSPVLYVLGDIKHHAGSGDMQSKPVGVLGQIANLEQGGLRRSAYRGCPHESIVVWRD